MNENKKKGWPARAKQAGRFTDSYCLPGSNSVNSEVHVMKTTRSIKEIAVMHFPSRLSRLLLVLFALASFQMLPARAATITTDRQDYAPFTFVDITGAGFQPGETVNNQVVQVIGPIAPFAYAPWDVTADANGGFSTTWYVFTDDLLGTTLELTATGKSSQLVATATFTDGSPACPPPPTGTPLTGTPAGGFAIGGGFPGKHTPP